jgi:hypothetical protein
MNLETVKLMLTKNAAAAVYQSAAGMVADMSSESQEREILTLASELSDNILAFKFASVEREQRARQSESARTT